MGVMMLILVFRGVEQNKMAFFVSTLPTVLGIACFAQCSLLNNIT